MLFSEGYFWYVHTFLPYGSFLQNLAMPEVFRGRFVFDRIVMAKSSAEFVTASIMPMDACERSDRLDIKCYLFIKLALNLFSARLLRSSTYCSRNSSSLRHRSTTAASQGLSSHKKRCRCSFIVFREDISNIPKKYIDKCRIHSSFSTKACF
jgi:hypothetical protein